MFLAAIPKVARNLSKKLLYIRTLIDLNTENRVWGSLIV